MILLIFQIFFLVEKQMNSDDIISIAKHICVILVHILDEAVDISDRTNSLEKRMNTTVLPVAPQVSRTLLNILVDLKNAAVCMVSICPLIS